MKQRKPRKQQFLLFDLCVHDREHHVIDVKDMPMKQWKETISLLDTKGLIPKDSDREAVLELLKRKL